MRKLPKTCKACNLCYNDGGKRETGRRAVRFGKAVYLDLVRGGRRQDEACTARGCRALQKAHVPAGSFQKPFCLQKAFITEKAVRRGPPSAACSAFLPPKPPRKLCAAASRMPPQSSRQKMRKRTADTDGGFSPAPQSSRAGGFFHGRAAVGNGEGGRYGRADMGRRGGRHKGARAAKGRGTFFFTNMPYPLAFSAKL